MKLPAMPFTVTDWSKAPGRRFVLKAGHSYQVSDFGDAAHRSSTKSGATLFIVD